jgi:Na+-driven multidrug efflux pump
MGAALATGVSQTLALLIVSTHLLFKKGVLRFGKFRLTKVLFVDILVHGLPGGIGELATPITTTCFNLVLADKIGDLGINSFSLICYVASFTVAIFYGTSEGLQPLFGQCYGSKNETDLKYYFKAGLWTNFIGSLIVTALVLLFSRPICALFGADDVTLAYTLKVMPLYAWGFVIMSFNVMISAYLYSTERSKHAIILNLLRSVVVNASVILLLPGVFGKDIIWFSFGIYEILVLFVAYYLLKKSETNGIIFE